jgi:hypothetical protein
MTSDIILPCLTNCAEGHLSAILQVSTQADFDEPFDQFLAKHVHVTVNGSHVSREHFKKQLQSEGALNQESATVKFDAAIEVPHNQDMPEQVRSRRVSFLCCRVELRLVLQAGLVSVFFDAVISENIRVFGGPAQRKVTSSVNVM